jgi:hypothetical protein
VIPVRVEILSPLCFYKCRFLSSISFEFPSRLIRIGSSAFLSSSLQSIVIPQSVEFIAGSAFADVKLSSLLIEAGNERFVVKQDFLIDIVDHKLILDFSESPDVRIPYDIEIIGQSSFSSCKFLSSITFESPSRLRRIESLAFSHSSLQSMVIPQSIEFIAGSAFSNVNISSLLIERGNERFVLDQDFLIDIIDHKLIRNFSKSPNVQIPSAIEIIGESSFAYCQSVHTILFELDSCLKRVESSAFMNSSIHVSLPSTVVFVASNAHQIVSYMSHSNADSCPEFNRWREVRERGVTVDFQRVVTSHLEIPVLDLTELDERSSSSSSSSSSQVYHRQGDGSLIVVKSISIANWIKPFHIEQEITNLMNLRHPLIASPIGFCESTRPRELKIGRLYAVGGSLSEVLQSAPPWWTATAKARTVAGIALSLRFAHGHGLLHGSLKASNILFDAEGHVQVSDFSAIRLKAGNARPFTGGVWSPMTDVCAFASLLSEIVIDTTVAQSGSSVGGRNRARTIPEFVSKIIEDCQPPFLNGERSFIDLIDILKAHDFQIVSGVDSVDVLRFVSSIEVLEQKSTIE